MIFGDDVRAAVDASASGWIASRCTGRAGTVGWLVPAGYERVVRLHPPPPQDERWWDAYRLLYETIAEVGGRHTSTPERAWFAIWEGHGFATATTHVAWFDPPADEAERRARDAHRDALQAEDVRRNAAIRAELDAIPRFDLPDRRHLLLEGTVAAVARLRDPAGDHWRNPDLFWPDDGRWFAATDVDIWSVYVAGTATMTAELAGVLSTPVEPVALDDPLPVEE